MSWLIFVVLSLECEQLLLSSRMEVIFFFLQIFHGTIIETDIAYFYLNENPVSTPVWLVLLLFSFFWEW